MFTISFVTKTYAPDLTVFLRTSGDGWIVDRGGDYAEGAWNFDETSKRYIVKFNEESTAYAVAS